MLTNVPCQYKMLIIGETGVHGSIWELFVLAAHFSVNIKLFLKKKNSLLIKKRIPLATVLGID